VSRACCFRRSAPVSTWGTSSARTSCSNSSIPISPELSSSAYAKWRACSPHGKIHSQLCRAEGESPAVPGSSSARGSPPHATLPGNRAHLTWQEARVRSRSVCIVWQVRFRCFQGLAHLNHLRRGSRRSPGWPRPAEPRPRRPSQPRVTSGAGKCASGVRRPAAGPTAGLPFGTD
jgi:hypothetical protein